jgi:hypothetical protein
MIIVQDPTTVTALLSQVRHTPLVYLYVGPDQIMPITSVLGALAGVALMFWNRLVGLFVKARAMFSKSADVPGKPSDQ